MIVSGITPADKRRSKVYLDGSFAFVLYNGEIKRFHIEEGEELAQELYSQIMDEVLCRRARERMLHLLKSTSRTELEIRRKLGEALYPQQAIDEAVAFAKRYHYIDDDDYAARYFEIYGDKKSVRQLAAELRRKGIDRETVNRLAGESGGDETEKHGRFSERSITTRSRRIRRSADARRLSWPAGDFPAMSSAVRWGGTLISTMFCRKRTRFPFQALNT